MKIEVELDGLFDEDGSPLPDMKSAVVEATSRHLLERIYSEVGEEIREKVLLGVRDTVQADVRARVRDVLNRPFRQTNRFGEPKGDELTLVEHVVEEAKAYLNEKIPEKGGHSYSEKKVPRYVLTARAMVDEVLQKELRPTIDDAKKQVTEYITSQLSGAIAEAIKKHFK